MRLTCPNCGAQYEIPAEVIPEAGRDVQCSNCNETWFQPNPNNDADIQNESLQAHFERRDLELSANLKETEPETFEKELESSQEETDDILAEDAPQLEAETAPNPSKPLPDTLDDDETGEDPEQVALEEDVQEIAEASYDEDAVDTDDEQSPEVETGPAEPDQKPAPVPRDIDPAIARILREEAEWEQEARKKESPGGLEVQPDLGLDPPQAAPVESDVQPRIVHVSEQTENIDDGPAPSSRRDLFPDIEEISSSLGGDEDHVPTTEPEANAIEQKRGFKSGFLLAVLVFVAATAIYITAGDIGQSFPALEGIMSSYTDAVDAGRMKLQESTNGLKDWFNQMSKPTAK